MYYGRRRNSRQSAFPLGKSTLGKIFVDQAFIRICTLRDVSSRGACVQVHQAYDIPETFELVLDGPSIKKVCRIVWRNKDKIGVEFAPDIDSRRSEHTA